MISLTTSKATKRCIILAGWLLTSRATITAEMERRLAMATRQAANANLEKAQVALGIQKAVFDFMAAKDEKAKQP